MTVPLGNALEKDYVTKKAMVTMSDLLYNTCHKPSPVIFPSGLITCDATKTQFL